MTTPTPTDKSPLSAEQTEEFAVGIATGSVPAWTVEEAREVVQRIAAAGAAAEREAHECPECPICGEGLVAEALAAKDRERASLQQIIDMLKGQDDRAESRLRKAVGLLRKAISRCLCEGLPWCEPCKFVLAFLATPSPQPPSREPCSENCDGCPSCWPVPHTRTPAPSASEKPCSKCGFPMDGHRIECPVGSASEKPTHDCDTLSCGPNGCPPPSGTPEKDWCAWPGCRAEKGHWKEHETPRPPDPPAAPRGPGLFAMFHTPGCEWMDTLVANCCQGNDEVLKAARKYCARPTPPTPEPPTAQIVDEFYKANPHLTIQAEPPKPAERHGFVGCLNAPWRHQGLCGFPDGCHEWKTHSRTYCGRPASDPVHEVTPRHEFLAGIPGRRDLCAKQSEDGMFYCARPASDPSHLPTTEGEGR